MVKELIDLIKCGDIQKDDKGIRFVLSDKTILKDILSNYKGKTVLCDRLPDKFARSFLRGVFESDGKFSLSRIKMCTRGEEMEAYVRRYINNNTTFKFDETGADSNNVFTINKKEDVESFVKFLYTAGPSVLGFRTLASEISNDPLCAHPDEDKAVLWIHDLLYHD